MRRSQIALGLAVLLVLAACRAGASPLDGSDDPEAVAAVRAGRRSTATVDGSVVALDYRFYTMLDRIAE